MCASLLLLIFFIWFENSALQVLLLSLFTAWRHRETLGVLSSTTIAMASTYGIFLLIDLMAESYLLFFLLSVFLLLPPENLANVAIDARGPPAVLMDFSKIEEMLVSSKSSGGAQDNLDTQQDDDQDEGGQQQQEEAEEEEAALREAWTSKQSSLVISTSSKTTSRKGSMDSSSSFSPGEQFTVSHSLQHSWLDHHIPEGEGLGGPGSGAESKHEPDDEEGEGDGMNVFMRIPHSSFFSEASFLSLPAQTSELRRRRAMQVSRRSFLSLFLSLSLSL